MRSAEDIKAQRAEQQALMQQQQQGAAMEQMGKGMDAMQQAAAGPQP